MTNRLTQTLALLTVALVATAGVDVHAAENNPLALRAREAASPATDRLIVHWKSPDSAQATKERAAAMQKLGGSVGGVVTEERAMSGQMKVLRLNSRKSGAELDRAIATLASDPAVDWVAPDLRRHILQLPSDPMVGDQWYFLHAQPSAIHADEAWDVTTGSNGIVVAVLDTGVRFDHPDLMRAEQGGKLLPGYDFVSGESSTKFDAANDGNGRDADPSDPGDWIDSTDKAKSEFADCTIEGSSWHGTRVAGLIGALTNNGVGIAGQAWGTWVLPVRVIGKCGGSDSDILDAMRWAAGLTVSGVPNNPYPARVLNLSLGADGACTSAYINVVAELASHGVTVIASAGNDGKAVSSPANCPGVIAVAGLRHAGTKVGYSNLGPEVALGAPAGNCVNTSGGACLFSILTLTNTGTTVPASSSYTDQFANTNLGTSFSAPLVSGTAALMLSVNSRLSPAILKARLQEGAGKPFPVNSTITPPATAPPPTCHVPAGDVQNAECNCTTDTCGAGMLNAQGSVAAAARPIAAIQASSPVNPGQPVNLDATGSSAACGRTITSYSWAEAPGSTQTPGLTSVNGATTALLAPASGTTIVRLIVTDDQGATDFMDVTVGAHSVVTTAMTPFATNACPTPITITTATVTPVPPAPAPTPAPTHHGGGGGGSSGLDLLALVTLNELRRRKNNRQIRIPPAAK